MALTNAPKTPNVNENWLFQFTADNDTCLEFDGSNDFVDFGNVFDDIVPIVDFSIEFWIKPDSVSFSGNKPILVRSVADSPEAPETNTNFQVFQNSAQILVFYEFGSGSNVSLTTSNVGLSANNWHHIAVVRSSTNDNIKVYKNGVLTDTLSSSNTDEDPTGATDDNIPLYIGRNAAGSNFFDGELAHVRIWSVARDDNQIARNYLRSIDNTATGLIGYWKLNEGTGTTVLDSSTNSNSGTINGATFTTGFDQFIHSFGLAFGHTLVSSETYYGTVLNKNISIRENLDIVKGTASTGNISVTAANFTFEGVDFYKHLFNYGEKNYHNKEVRVFAQFNGATSLSNCQRIFTGRLASVKLNDQGHVTMQINTHRPYDNITFPQEKSNRYDVYVPTVYGSFEPNLSNAGTPTFSDTKLFPVPVLETSQTTITTLMPKAYADGSNSHINLWLGDKVFLPAAGQTNPYSVTDETELQEDINVLITKLNKRFGGKTRAKFSDVTSSVNKFTDTFKAFDGSNSTFATGITTGTNSTTGSVILPFSGPSRLFVATVFSNVHVFFKSTVTGDVSVSVVFDSPINDYDTESFTIVVSVPDTSTINEAVFPISGLNLPTDLSSAVTFILGASSKTISVSDVQVETRCLIFGTTAKDENEQDSATISNLKFMYSGGAGLTALWDSSAILHGHDIHRDLLMRFAGISSTEPTGYSGLNADRFQDAWKARYWQLEPTSLKDNLDKLAYEFSFNYKIDAAGNLKYINVLQTGEYNTLRNAGSILNLTKNDLANITIGTTPLNEVVSKMQINNNLSPAEKKYFTQTNITNTTSLAKYNHGEKEGFQEINLDYNVGTPTTNSNPNNNFYAYQNNLIGEVKTVISCDIVNCAKGYQLETGDVITFTDMPVDLFGETFSTSIYFMIVEYKRSIGKVSITAREVG